MLKYRLVSARLVSDLESLDNIVIFEDFFRGSEKIMKSLNIFKCLQKFSKMSSRITWRYFTFQHFFGNFMTK